MATHRARPLRGVVTDPGFWGRCAVPSGAGTGGCCDEGVGVLIQGSDGWFRSSPTLGGKGGADDFGQLLKLTLARVGIAEHRLEVMTPMEQGP